MAAAETHARFDRSTALTRTDLVEASRSVEREAGVWTLGESDEPTGSLTVRAANNPVVKALINGRDADALPDGFNPDHATGDSGDDYPYGQCTWWAYERRKQLGLPVGGRFGNGGLWAAYDMFRGCGKLTRLDVSRWGMGNVTDMSEMFYGCNNLTALDGLAEWNTGKTIKMSSMFYGCSKLADVDIASWDVRKVTTTESMLRGTPIARLDLSAWNTNSLTNMRYMFEYCTSLTSLNMDG